MQEEYERACNAASKSNQRVRDLVQQKNSLKEHLEKLSEQFDKNNSEYLDLKSLQYNYKEQLATLTRGNEQFKMKATVAERALQEANDLIDRLKSQLYRKNQNLDEVREDAKGNAVQKIKLGMKLQAQASI